MDGSCQPGDVADVVSSGAEPASRRSRALLITVVLLAVVAVGADRWWADRERTRLGAAVMAGEQTVSGSRTSLAGLAAYSAGLLYAADVPADARRSAYGNLGDDARRWVPRVDAAREAVAGTDVLPWHTGTREAREAYDLRLQVWADLLRRFADDPQSGVGDDPVVTQARVTAREALRAAGLDLLD